MDQLEVLTENKKICLPDGRHIVEFQLCANNRYGQSIGFEIQLLLH